MQTDTHDYETTGDGASRREHGDHEGRRVDRASAFDRLVERLTEYLRTRTSEHWVMFLAGLVVGSLLG